MKREREKREIILNFNLFCVINVKYEGKKKRKKVTSRSTEKTRA